MATGTTQFVLRCGPIVRDAVWFVNYCYTGQEFQKEIKGSFRRRYESQ